MTGDKEDDLFDDVFTDEDVSDEGENVSQEDVEPEKPAQTDEVKQPDPEPEDSEVQTQVTDENENNHQVPIGHLIAERKERQEAQNQLRDMQAEIAQLKQQNQQFQNHYQQQQQAQQQPVTSDDFYDDPDAAIQNVNSSVDQKISNSELNMSEMLARHKYGDEIVDKAVNAAVSNGLNQHFAAQRDPYRSAIEWYQQQQVVNTVGTDLDAYKKQVLEEAQKDPDFVKSIMSNSTVETQSSQQKKSLPPSLANTTSGGDKETGIVSDQDIFNDVFN